MKDNEQNKNKGIISAIVSDALGFGFYIPVFVGAASAMFGGSAVMLCKTLQNRKFMQHLPEDFVKFTSNIAKGGQGVYATTGYICLLAVFILGARGIINKINEHESELEEHKWKTRLAYASQYGSLALNVISAVGLVHNLYKSPNCNDGTKQRVERMVKIIFANFALNQIHRYSVGNIIEDLEQEKKHKSKDDPNRGV